MSTIVFNTCIYSLSLDILLDGGIYTAEVTEVIGHAAAGKTQFCLNVALSVATATEQNSLIVDTGGCFCSQRLQDILESRGMSAEVLGIFFIFTFSLKPKNLAKTFA